MKNAKLNVRLNKVENMQSSNGNDVPNQFLITTKDGVYFQSYSSIIAFRPNEGPIELDREYWDYSKTTGKYRNQFLGKDKKRTLKAIASGQIILTNLN